MSSVGYFVHYACFQAMLCLSFIFSKTTYNKTVIRFGFRGIRKNQGLGKCYQPWLSARLITLFSTLIIPDATKTSLQCKHVTSRNGKHSFYKSITVILPAVPLSVLSLKKLRLSQSQLPFFLPNSSYFFGPIFRIF